LGWHHHNWNHILRCFEPFLYAKFILAALMTPLPPSFLAKPLINRFSRLRASVTQKQITSKTHASTLQNHARLSHASNHLFNYSPQGFPITTAAPSTHFTALFAVSEWRARGDVQLMLNSWPFSTAAVGGTMLPVLAKAMVALVRLTSLVQ
jgi:hypothetical protein